MKMKNLNQDKQSTLLDLNMYVLHEIFKELVYTDDKINLAQAHPYLAEAFGYHGRSQINELIVSNFQEHQLSFILKNYGERVQCVRINRAICVAEVQLLLDNCSNVNRLHMIVDTEVSSGIYTKLAGLPLTRLDINLRDLNGVLEQLRNCKTLRKLTLIESQDIDSDFIRIILDILNENGVTPEEPFTLVVYGFQMSSDDNEYLISKCEKSNILNIKREDLLHSFGYY